MALTPERSVVASFGAGSIMSALRPFTDDLCVRLAAMSDTWVSPTWHGILNPMTSQTFKDLTLVAVMTVVMYFVSDKPWRKPKPVDSSESGDANAITPPPKGD